MKTQRDTLVLITADAPGCSVTEESFLAPELPLLHASFPRVIRLSMNDRPSVTSRVIASFNKVALQATLAAHGESHNVLRANGYGAYSVIWRDRIREMILSGEIDPSRTLFYTFWFDFATVGLALLAKRYNLAIISRAHGYDIREEHSAWLRRQTLENITALYAASSYSCNILKSRWNEYSDRIHVARLGSREPIFHSIDRKDASEGELTIMSCSRPVELKRVECVARVVEMIARRAGDRPVRWIHAGGDSGGLHDRCGHIVSAPNLTVEWLGEISNDKVHDIYASRPVNWHVLMSRAEGGMPVSIGEAMSYGIPTVATDVGGVSELVKDGFNGILLSPDVTVDEHDPILEAAADRILKLGGDTETYNILSRNAFATWSEQYDAKRLRGQFVENILLI